MAERGIENVPILDTSELRKSDEFISLSSVWSWSQKYYYNKKDIWALEARSWVALSNALNHAGYESLLYSIIGLEYIYVKGEKNVKSQLRKSIPAVFNGVTSDEINTLYKIRSEFAHGSLFFPIYGECVMSEEFHNVNKAAAILLETVRLLIKNDATRINVVNGKVIFLKDSTVGERLMNLE